MDPKSIFFFLARIWAAHYYPDGDAGSGDGGNGGESCLSLKPLARWREIGTEDVPGPV